MTPPLPSPGATTRRAELGFWSALTLLAGGATAYVFAAQTSQLTTQLIGVHNDALYAFNTLVWEWRALAALAPCSLLDAPLMQPLPHGLAYGDNLVALALLGAPLALAGHEVLAYNLVLLATFLLTALCTAGFARALGATRLVAAALGLAVAFVPIRLSTLYHLNNLAMMGLPLSAWALVRWHQTRSWRWLAVGGLAVYVQLLSSIQLLVHFTLLAGLWLLWLWGRARFAVRRRELGQALTAAAVLGLLILPWARVYAAVRSFLPAARSTDEMIWYRPPLGDYLTRLFPGWVWLAAFAVAALLLLARSTPARRTLPLPAAGAANLGPLVLLSLAGLVLSQGPAVPTEQGLVPLPYVAAMQLFPLLGTIRAPQRIMLVVYVLGAGAGAVGLTWLGHQLARLPWPGRLARYASALIGGAALAGALALLPRATEGTRPPPRLPFVAAAKGLPEGAVLGPVPLALNWPDRPPLDHASVTAGLRMIGGYGGAIPEAFWLLAREVARFPAPEALAALRAAGATHALVHLAALTPAARRDLAALDPRQLAPVWRGGGWELWALGAPPLAPFDPLRVPAAGVRLRGPSRVAPGQLVTLAVDLPLTEPRFDPVLRRAFLVELHDHAGRLFAAERGLLTSPGLVGARGLPYQLSFTAPDVAGAFTVVARWPGGPGVRLPLPVDAALATTDRTPVRRAELEAAPPARAYHGQTWPLAVQLRNADPHLWLARSRVQLPAHRGALVPHVTLHGPAPLHRFFAPWEAYTLLPHDLAPGDTATTALLLPAPAAPGTYRVQLKLAAHQLENPDSPGLDAGELVVE